MEESIFELTIDAAILQDAAKKLQRIVKRLPIWLACSGNDLTMHAWTDDTEIFLHLPCTSTADNEVSITGEALVEGLKHVTGGELKISYNGRDGLKCVHDRGEFFLLCTDPRSSEKTRGYEEITQTTATLSVDGEALTAALAKALTTALKKDNGRPALLGVLIDADEDAVNVVSSSAQVLSRLPLAGAKYDKPLKVDIPAEAVALLSAIRPHGEVQILEGERKSSILCDGLTMRFEDYARVYPNWRSVIPDPDNIRVRAKMRVSDLREALALCAGKPSLKNSVPVKFHFMQGLTVLSYHDSLRGIRNERDIWADISTAEIFDMFFPSYNMQLLIDRLKPQEFFTLGIIDPTRLCFVQSEREGEMLLLMPACPQDY